MCCGGFRSSNGLDASLATQAIAHPENVWDIDPTVVQALEDPQGFEVLTDAVGAMMAGGQLDVVSLCFRGKTVENAFRVPTVGNVFEFTRHGYAGKGFQNLVHPRIILSKLFDSCS